MSAWRSTEAEPVRPAVSILLPERLARTVCELDPNPRNAFAVTVLLEVLGYTDARAIELGYADVFALGRDVFEHIEFLRIEDAPHTEPRWRAIPAVPSPSPLLSVVTQQVVWLIMVLLTMVWGRSVWSADHLPPAIAQAIVVGILGSLVVSGGFQYAISQRLNFHTAQRDTSQAGAFLRQAHWSGALVMAVGAAAVGAGFQASRPGDPLVPVVAAGYFLLHGVYRIAVVPLIALNDVAGVLLSTGAGVGVFVLADARLAEAGIEPVHALVIAPLAGLTALWLGSLTRTRTLLTSAPIGVLPVAPLAAKARAQRGPRPRWPVICLDAGPWFATGVLYYAFLFGGRPIGWLLPPAQRFAYESGLDLGLLAVIPVAVVASWTLHRYYQWLHERLRTTGLHLVPALRTEAAQQFAQAVWRCRYFGFAGALVLLVLTRGAPWGTVPARTFLVFRITAVGLTMALPALLLSVGLLTSLRALWDASALLVCGLLLQVAAGLAMVWMGAAGWLALALVGSALALGELAVWRAYRLVREIDRFYYGAF
jgi:hypothetical protein